GPASSAPLCRSVGGSEPPVVRLVGASAGAGGFDAGGGHKAGGRRHMAGNEGSMAAERLRVEPAEGEGDGLTIEALIASGQHREALAACARTYALPLGRLCMAFTGSQAESEELVQETLLAAFDAFPQYRGEGTVRAFLFGIARRLCGRHV